MSFLGSVARTLSSAGNDYSSAKFSLDDLNRQIAQAKLKDLMDQLQIQEGQQRISASRQQQAMQTPEGQRAYLKGILGREPTDDEMRVYAGLTPKFTQGKGQPIPGPQIGRPDGTYWLPTLDSQQQVVGYTQTGPPAGAGKPTRVGPTPDKDSVTGYSMLYRAADGTETRVKDIIIPGLTPTTRQGYVAGTNDQGDPILIPITTTTSRNVPGVPGARGGGGSARQPIVTGPPKPNTPQGKNALAAQQIYQQYQLAQSIASKPLSPTSSMALAGIADKVLGPGHVADLKARGQSKGIMGVGAGYSPVTYTKDEADEIVAEIQAKYQSLQAPTPNSGGSDGPPSGNFTVVAP